MTRRQLLALSAVAAAPAARGASALDLAGRRELFIDRFLIEELQNASLRLHTPRREADAITLDKPWEGPFSNYVTVIRDGAKVHLYYRGLPVAGKDGSTPK